MYRYIFNKTIASIITFFIVVVLLYFLIVGFKGDPYGDAPADVKPEDWESMKTAMGIYDPIFVRFGNYINGLFHGDWGPVYHTADVNAENIPKMFFAPLKTSMLVAVPSFFIGMIVGLCLGFWAGYKRGKTTDVIINNFVMFFIAVPTFVFAAFALVIGPMIGLPVIFQNHNSIGVSTELMIQSLIMPIVVNSLFSLAGWSSLIRIDVASILKSDYILAARTRGFSEWKIFKSYVLRNSMYNYIGSISTMFTVVFSSSIVTERFFNVEGTSTMLNNAMQTGEINIIMFNLIFFTGLGLVTNVIAEIAIFSINPIVKANFSSKTSIFTKVIAKYKREKAEVAKLEVKND